MTYSNGYRVNQHYPENRRTKRCFVWCRLHPGKTASYPTNATDFHPSRCHPAACLTPKRLKISQLMQVKCKLRISSCNILTDCSVYARRYEDSIPPYQPRTINKKRGTGKTAVWHRLEWFNFGDWVAGDGWRETAVKPVISASHRSSRSNKTV